MSAHLPSQPRLHRFSALDPHGFHEVAYTEWGREDAARIVICVHGLTRNSRDFDALAAALSRDSRVACMDVVGRGRSDWLEHGQDYGFSLYQSDAAALIARLTATRLVASPVAGWRRWFGQQGVPAAWDVRQVDWIGTSMGGLIGMLLAARKGSPIRRLVLNDVGPMVPWSALRRLKGTHGNGPSHFEDIAAAEHYLRDACASFGPISDEQWREVTRHSISELESGGFRLGWDPGIIDVMQGKGDDDTKFTADFFGIALWSIWDQVRCPVLVLRGENSDLLTADTVRRMQESGPPVQVVEFPGVGHAPWLMSAEQIAVVRDFLLAPEDAS